MRTKEARSWLVVQPAQAVQDVSLAGQSSKLTDAQLNGEFSSAGESKTICATD